MVKNDVKAKMERMEEEMEEMRKFMRSKFMALERVEENKKTRRNDMKLTGPKYAAGISGSVGSNGKHEEEAHKKKVEAIRLFDLEKSKKVEADKLAAELLESSLKKGYRL